MQKRVFLMLLVVAELLWLSGCASIADLTAKIDAKPSCCTSFAEFKYESLSTSEIQTFTLNESSPIYAFQQGKSYFKAYTLPQARDTTKKLLVRSIVTGSDAFETMKLSQVFCPSATFLDSQYKVLEVIENLPTAPNSELRKFSLNANFITQIPVPLNATHVVFHTNPNRYGIPISRSVGGGGYMVGKAFVFEQGGYIRHPCAPIANAEVNFY